MTDGGRPKYPVTYDVVVKNMPSSITEDGVRDIFGKYGAISSVTLKDDLYKDGKFGFVRFLSEDDLHHVLSDNNFMIDGNKLLVSRGRKDQKKEGMPKGPGGDNQQWKSYQQQPANPGWKNGNQSTIKPDLVTNHQSTRSQSTPKDMIGSDFKRGHVENLLVTHVDTPCIFWAQNVEDAVNIAELSTHLAMFCPSANPVAGQPQKNKSYAAQFSEDGMWYRCRVENYIDEFQSEVRYIDYGNSEVVQNKRIKEVLPKQSNTKALSNKYILYGLSPGHDPETMGYSQGVNRLKELIDQKVVTATVGGKTQDFTYVMVSADGLDVNQIILDEGFAVRRTPKNDRNLPGKPNAPDKPRGPNDFSRGFHNQTGRAPGGMDAGSPQPMGTQIGRIPSLSPMSSATPRSAMVNAPGSKHSFKINTDNNGVPQQSPQQNWEQHPPEPQVMTSIFDRPPPPLTNITQNEPKIDMWDSGMSHPPPPVSAPIRHPSPSASPLSAFPPAAQMALQSELNNARSEEQRLQRELINKDSDIKYLEQQRNSTLLEHAKLKGDLKALVQEHDQMRQQLRETSLNQKLKTVMDNVQKVKQLRIQFPTERQGRDNIEWAINLVRDHKETLSPANVEACTSVKVAMDSYNVAQENIKICVDMRETELDALILCRDVMRRKLHAALVEFEQSVQGLPLQDKMDKLSTALSSLEETHGVFLKPEITDALQLTEALGWYDSWKCKKTAEFRECRALTNACHNSLNGALVLLQQELALDVLPSGGSSSNVANLEEPLKKFSSAVHNEIMVTDIENSDEASFVTLLLKTLVGGIRSELSEITQLVSLQARYAQLAARVGQWLDARPDVTQLAAVRKTIKGLKSKLRHKLADKQDLEESDDSHVSELSHIHEELTVIWDELQDAFSTEDGLLSELAELSEHHYPELGLVHSDIGIENEIEYGGLVKKNRSLEYFDVRPLPNCDKSGVLKSSFCKEPIVIKEYIIDDGLGVKKTDFLRRAMAYHTIVHPNILPLEAIFFSKGQRHAHLQLPFHEHNAHSIVSKGPLSVYSLHTLLRGVLEGLKCLHDAKLVHGAVHPNNVFVGDDGRGVLADFDFTKSLQQRTEREYTTPNNLKFVSPELAASGQISRASDVFNFGLLALWLLRPAGPIATRANGVPDMENINLGNTSVCLFVRSVLHENPALRPSAAELLTHVYFLSTPPEAPGSPREELTLQLRPKQPSPPAADKQHSGILKKASPVSTPPPLETFSVPAGVTFSSASITPPPQTPTPPPQSALNGHIFSSDTNQSAPNADTPPPASTTPPLFSANESAPPSVNTPPPASTTPPLFSANESAPPSVNTPPPASTTPPLENKPDLDQEVAHILTPANSNEAPALENLVADLQISSIPEELRAEVSASLGLGVPGLNVEGLGIPGVNVEGPTPSPTLADRMPLPDSDGDM